MSTRIRLRRMGATKRPFFRVVVTDQRSPRDGRFIENIGKYHPLEDPSLIEIDEERALHWLRSGAQPSDSVRNLLDRIGVWEKFSAERPSVIRREEIQRSNARSKEAKAKRAEAARPKPAVAPGAEVAEPAKAESAPAPVESTEVESTEAESAQVEPAESPEAPAAQPTEETAAE